MSKGRPARKPNRSNRSSAGGAAQGAKRSAPRAGARRQGPQPRGGSAGGSSRRSAPPEKRRSRQRDPDDLGGGIVEGRQAVLELLRVGRRKVRELMVADDLDDSAIVAEILDLASDDKVPITRVSRRKLDDEAHTDAPQGVIAIASSIASVEIDVLTRPRRGVPPFLVVLDGITDPGNLGAILRTAEVAGVTGVVIPRHRAARLTPAAVKSAAGAVEHLPISLVGGLPATLSQLAEAGVWSVGLAAHDGRSIWESTAAFDGPVALVLGAEGAGLGRLVSERCDELVTIPQFGHLDSLNVANAAAVACYEVVRRRS